MFCKYCGAEITDDSIFCAQCGKKVQEDVHITNNEKSDDGNSIRVKLVADEKDIWKDTDSLQWVKPIVARVMQTIFLTIGLFFLCYGIVWSFMIERRVSKTFPHFPYFNEFIAYAYEPLGIIDVYVDLEKDDPDFSLYEKEWYSLYNKQYVDKKIYKELGIDTASLTYYHSPYGDQLSPDQWMQISTIEGKKLLSGCSIPYEYMKYYDKIEQLAISKFRTQTLLILILPALLLIIFSIIWIIKVTPKIEKKAILPRDYADKIEDYSWYGFTIHKYIRFIKNDKYGILDAANRSITVPATFDLIEWREANKSYDGVLDGSRKTYNMDLK